MMRRLLLILLTPVLLLLAATAQANITLASIFSNDAVLQRLQPIKIWGTGTAGETIRVSLGDDELACVVNERGRWSVSFSARPASKNPAVLRVATDAQQIERTGILLGDVWHASGQSNMGMNVGAVAKSIEPVKQLVSKANLPMIRFLRINEGPAIRPREALSANVKWTSCSPDTVSSFSAAAFFFAKKLHEELDVPIGVIDTSRGGTPIEPFIPRQAFKGHPTLLQELELGDKEDLDGLWRLAGGVRARDANWLPGRLFHSRISPIREFAVRGCIWYQGESNCGDREDPRDYQFKMRALIAGWRSQLERPDLPFYFVQLPGSGARENWPYLREQQRLCMDVSNVGMVVTIDLEHPDIHPPNKLDVGDRLARWALAKNYEKPVSFSGPLYAGSEFEKERAVVRFNHATSGLMVAGKSGLAPPRETPNVPLRHFELAGERGEWQAANAKIDGDKVIVTSDHIVRPTAVRYAYGASPAGCNLFNRDGLPASPFCSHPDRLDCDPNLPK